MTNGVVKSGAVKDVLVVGGGPVGLVCALHAAAAGLDVAVIEPRTGPIDKACGEGIMPRGVTALQGLGVDPDGCALRGITYTDGAHTAVADFRDGSGRGVRRTHLHAVLQDALHRAGVPVVRERVDDIKQDDRSVSAAGVTARYLIGADGLHSTVRRRVGTERPVPAVRRRWGLCAHYDVAPWSDRVEVHWSDVCEAYVTPVSPSEVNVAVLGRGGLSFDEALATVPSLRDHLPATLGSKVRGAGPLRQASGPRVIGRVLLVGDAAGSLDALTGTGLTLGFAEAEAAIRRIVQGRVRRYELDHRRITMRDRALASPLLAAARHRGMRRRIVPAAERFPRVFAAAVHGMA